MEEYTVYDTADGKIKILRISGTLANSINSQMANKESMPGRVSTVIAAYPTSIFDDFAALKAQVLRFSSKEPGAIKNFRAKIKSSDELCDFLREQGEQNADAIASIQEAKQYLLDLMEIFEQAAIVADHAADLLRPWDFSKYASRKKKGFYEPHRVNNPDCLKKMGIDLLEADGAARVQPVISAVSAAKQRKKSCSKHAKKA